MSGDLRLIKSLPTAAADAARRVNAILHQLEREQGVVVLRIDVVEASGAGHKTLSVGIHTGAATQAMRREWEVPR